MRSVALGQHQPLEAPAALDRTGGGMGRADDKPGRERSFDLLSRNREWWAVGSLAQWVEAGQEQAARSEKGADDSQILLAPCGVDGAEARVFPHAVEDAAMGLRE